MTAQTDKLSDCCTSGALHEGTPVGKAETVYGLPTYVVGNKSDRIIVMLADVFGWELNNTRLLADKYAEAGFYVLLPDFFFGDALPAEVEHQLMPTESDPPRGFFKAVTDTFKGASQGVPFMYNHREAVSRPIIDKYFSAVRSSNPSAKIGAVGFCWGGRYAILLTHADAPVQVDCAVACHPSMLSIPSEIQKIAKPVSIQVGDKDMMMSVKQADLSRSTLEQKGIAGEVTVYPGMVHGFACRGDLSKEEVLKGRDECTVATLAWFNKYLSASKSSL